MARKGKLTGPRSGADLRRRVLEEHAISGTGAMALLDTACAALDQALEAEKILKADGLTTHGTRGPRVHPLVVVSRDARNRLISALRALGLELS